MQKDEVEKLIPAYISDGFEQVSIELKDENCIQINKNYSIVFSDKFLSISTTGYLFHIRYSFIESISV